MTRKFQFVAIVILVALAIWFIANYTGSAKSPANDQIKSSICESLKMLDGTCNDITIDGTDISDGWSDGIELSANFTIRPSKPQQFLTGPLAGTTIQTDKRYKAKIDISFSLANGQWKALASKLAPQSDGKIIVVE
jgi:hypothetical protein